MSNETEPVAAEKMHPHVDDIDEDVDMDLNEDDGLDGDDLNLETRTKDDSNFTHVVVVEKSLDKWRN